jgi:hypothetical protein
MPFISVVAVRCCLKKTLGELGVKRPSEGLVRGLGGKKTLGGLGAWWLGERAWWWPS